MLRMLSLTPTYNFIANLLSCEALNFFKTERNTPCSFFYVGGYHFGPTFKCVFYFLHFLLFVRISVVVGGGVRRSSQTSWQEELEMSDI